MQAVDRFTGMPVTEKEPFAPGAAEKAIERYHGATLQQPLWSDA